MYIAAYSLPFQSKFAKCIRGQPFSVLSKPNHHQPLSSSRAILADQQLKRALMALGTQPGKKVCSCDVGMAGFHQHLLSSEMKVSLCTSLKRGSVNLTGRNRELIFLLSAHRAIILPYPIFLTDRKTMEKEGTRGIHSDIMLKGKPVLIFLLSFYSVKIHINKKISFRRGESQPRCYFPLQFSSQQVVYPTPRTNEEHVSGVSTWPAVAAALQQSRRAGQEADLKEHQARGEVPVEKRFHSEGNMYSPRC